MLFFSKAVFKECYLGCKVKQTATLWTPCVIFILHFVQILPDGVSHPIENYETILVK